MYLVKRCYYSLLQKRYGFDKWHSATPYEARSYKKSVVEIASKLGASSVVEIGCGLGEILSRINAQHKFGVDRELAVIEAAIYLNSSKCSFYPIELDNFVDEFPHEKFELLIMVNWIHEIPWEKLSRVIANIVTKFDVKYLLIDVVDDTAEGFQHYHQETQVRSLGTVVDMVIGLDSVRNLYMLNVERINIRD